MGIVFMSITNFNLEMVLDDSQFFFSFIKITIQYSVLSEILLIQATKRLDLNVIVLLFGVQCGTGTVFLYCYIGSLTTEQFFRYGNKTYESLWYKMPMEQRKYMKFMIANAQRPHVFHGFGIIDLNLMAFTAVMR